MSGRYQHQSFIDFANEEKVNSYFLLNSRVSYNLHGFQCSVFLNNITNAKYFNQGYVDFDGSKSILFKHQQIFTLQFSIVSNDIIRHK